MNVIALTAPFEVQEVLSPLVIRRLLTSPLTEPVPMSMPPHNFVKAGLVTPYQHQGYTPVSALFQMATHVHEVSFAENSVDAYHTIWDNLLWDVLRVTDMSRLGRDRGSRTLHRHRWRSINKDSRVMIDGVADVEPREIPLSLENMHPYAPCHRNDNESQDSSDENNAVDMAYLRPCQVVYHSSTGSEGTVPHRVLLHGEERCNPGHFEDALQHLRQRQWSSSYFGSFPGQLGYAAAGCFFQFFAVMGHSGFRESGLEHVSRKFDLRRVDHRLQLLQTVINLTRIFPLLLTPSPLERDCTRYGCFSTDYRRNGVSLEFLPDRVVKTLSQNWFLATKLNRNVLSRAYRTVQGHPHAVQAISVDDSRPDGGLSLTLQPVGVTRLPASERQLCDAIKAVLLCLTQLHSRGMCHRDLRWPNVLSHNDDWFVIDFDTAGPVDQVQWLPVNAEYIPPECQTSTPHYGLEGDLYQVGVLIALSGLWESLPVDGNARALHQQLTDPSPAGRLTVETALRSPWFGTRKNRDSMRSSEEQSCSRITVN